MSLKRTVNKLNAILHTELGNSKLGQPRFQWGFSRPNVYDFGVKFIYKFYGDADETNGFNLSRPNGTLYLAQRPVLAMQTTGHIEEATWIMGQHDTITSVCNPDGYYIPFSTEAHGVVRLRVGIEPTTQQTYQVIELVRETLANIHNRIEEQNRRRAIKNWSRPILPDGTIDFSERPPAGSDHARRVDKLNDETLASGVAPGQRGGSLLIYNPYDNTKETQSNEHA